MVALRAETTGCRDVNSFGGAAAAIGFLVESKKLSRPDYADGPLRTGAGVDRLGSDAFELRPLETARTTTRVDYKLAADVNRLRSDALVLRVLRCLTFEVSWRQRRGALDSKRKMGRRPCAWWPARHAVGAQLDRRVRRHFCFRREPWLVEPQR